MVAFQGLICTKRNFHNGLNTGVDRSSLCIVMFPSLQPTSLWGGSSPFDVDPFGQQNLQTPTDPFSGSDPFGEDPFAAMKPGGGGSGGGGGNPFQVGGAGGGDAGVFGGAWKQSGGVGVNQKPS